MGSYPRMQWGKTTFLVVTDCFSHWVNARLVRKVITKSIIETLEWEFFQRFVELRILLSDKWSAIHVYDDVGSGRIDGSNYKPTYKPHRKEITRVEGRVANLTCRKVLSSVECLPVTRVFLRKKPRELRHRTVTSQNNVLLKDQGLRRLATWASRWISVGSKNGLERTRTHR